MKIIKFIKKNYKKLIIQFVSIVSAFVMLSITVSADTFDYSINMPISKPNVAENLFYIEVLYNNGISGELDIISVTDSQDNSYKEQPEIHVKYSNNSITLYPRWSYYKLNCFWITSVGNCGTYNSYDSDDNTITISFSNIIGIKLYGNFSLDSSSQPLPNRFSWNFNYSTSAITTNQLDTIIGLLQSQNSSNNQINESIQDSANEILNGGGSRPEVSTDNVDEHNSLENALSQNNAQGVEDTKNMFTDFTVGENLTNGLLAVTNVFNSVSNAGWLNDITKTALVLGGFGFVLGIVQLVRKASDK